MMRYRAIVALVVAAAMLGACSSSNVAEEGVDVSKLDADMEKRAQEIEARADEAADAAEEEASAELARIEEEARAADAANADEAESNQEVSK